MEEHTWPCKSQERHSWGNHSFNQVCCRGVAARHEVCTQWSGSWARKEGPEHTNTWVVHLALEGLCQASVSKVKGHAEWGTRTPTHATSKHCSRKPGPTQLLTHTCTAHGHAHTSKSHWNLFDVGNYWTFLFSLAYGLPARILHVWLPLATPPSKL